MRLPGTVEKRRRFADVPDNHVAAGAEAGAEAGAPTAAVAAVAVVGTGIGSEVDACAACEGGADICL